MTKPKHPALVTLMAGRWDDAFGWLHHASEETIGAERAQRLLDKCGDRQAIQDEIRETVDALYALGTHQAGELALAWSMMCCHATYPPSFRGLLPQLQYALDAADLSADDDGDCRDRLRYWWQCGAGAFAHEKRSPFAIAAAMLSGAIIKDPSLESDASEVDVAQWFRTPYPGPTLTVMPAAKATKLNNHNRPFQEILDKALPLVVARGLADARKRLSYEFPHASAALSVLFKDLREGQPVRIKPVLLVGPMGAGKSRIVRRWATSICQHMHIHRHDGAASGDNHFGGASKIWSNTEASVPARAILQSRTANPLVFVDEIDKAATNSNTGSLWSAMLPMLDGETASRYRDQSLDCEVDLSWCNFVATANDATVLPDMLKDRFVIVRMKSPTLVDLPLLAASIMEDLSRENPERVGDEPLAPDELMVIAKAWEKAGFSMRKLQKIVRATLEARDANAMRH